MQLTHPRHGSSRSDASPIPFPRIRGSAINRHDARDGFGSPVDVVDALNTVSRRITDLARELKCLGYFDDSNSDRPRAA